VQPNLPQNEGITPPLLSSLQFLLSVSTSVKASSKLVVFAPVPSIVSKLHAMYQQQEFSGTHLVLSHVVPPLQA
jgi:hypothetical protein